MPEFTGGVMARYAENPTAHPAAQASRWAILGRIPPRVEVPMPRHFTIVVLAVKGTRSGLVRVAPAAPAALQEAGDERLVVVGPAATALVPAAALLAVAAPVDDGEVVEVVGAAAGPGADVFEGGPL